MPACPCHTPPLNPRQFTRVDVGVDKTHGRYADVYLDTCNPCGARWLHYLAEYESYTASGRWYRAIIPEGVVKSLTPQTAASIISAQDWWLRGGSYFASTGESGAGHLQTD